MGDRHKGESLTEFVRAGGPLRGAALHRLALGSAAAMARMHAHGVTGLRLTPDNVALGTRGQVLVGVQGSPGRGGPAADVRDWAELVTFASGSGALPQPLRGVVERCRRPEPAGRPSAAHVVRVLLGHTMATAVASVDDLLRK
ncbi:hypothetical protein ACNF49_03065 [Actinomadura sp. ATCC 39365]|uniref:hypothetical protein n=1 Tax=Nonomuraea sp. NPDC005692 TaxID=3157168 RepID=UPI0033C799FF